MKLLLALCAAALFVLVNSVSYRRRPTGVVDNADCPKSCKKDCPLFSLKSNQISASVFRTMILPYEWSGIYTIELQQGNVPAFGKYHVKWVESGGTFKRLLPLFDLQERTCADLNGESSVITETTCGVKLVQETPTYWSDRFFSQDPSQYLLYEICETPACDKGFVDLLVRKTRTDGGEVDLDKLPWHKIAADLKKLRGLTMDDPSVRYLWVDQECPFT